MKNSTEILQHFVSCQIAAGKGPGEVVDALQLLTALIDVAVSDGVAGAVDSLYRRTVAEDIEAFSSASRPPNTPSVALYGCGWRKGRAVLKGFK